jgi:hypothetical protein
LAGHNTLFPRLVRAIRGQWISPPTNFELKPKGSINYKLMALVTEYLRTGSAAARKAIVDFLRRMQQVGHLTVGKVSEIGAPGMHWTFNVGSVTGALLWALRRDHWDVVEAAVAFLMDEVGFNLRFRHNNWVVAPAPRIKNEKAQSPVDGYRNWFTATAVGEGWHVPESWLGSDQAIACSALRAVLMLQPELVSSFKVAEFPKTPYNVYKQHLLPNGFEAEIEDTPENRKLLGKDACHWVRVTSDELGNHAQFAYDWEEYTPPDGEPEEV